MALDVEYTVIRGQNLVCGEAVFYIGSFLMGRKLNRKLDRKVGLYGGQEEGRQLINGPGVSFCMEFLKKLILE